jgi:hypothetical protein
MSSSALQGEPSINTHLLPPPGGDGDENDVVDDKECD